MYNKFWIPHYKYQLVDWLHNCMGINKGKLNRMCLSNLYGMYFKIRNNNDK